jgi:hypothetical protein
LQSRMDGAQFVATESLTPGGIDCTSTMIMKPEKLGASSAEIATSESENSRMTQTSLSEPCSICGRVETSRILISKSDIFGWGLNLQHCHNQVFVGVTYSFEKTYQALRRSWRYGQKYPVDAYLIFAESEGGIMQAIREKQEAHHEMQAAMTQAMRENGLTAQSRRELIDYDPRMAMALPGWLKEVAW